MGKKKGKNKKIEEVKEEGPIIFEGETKVEAEDENEDQSQFQDEIQEVTTAASGVLETAATGSESGDQKGDEEKTGMKKGKKGKKGKKDFDPLGDDPMVFKAISFEHALTKQEKAAGKAEKLKAKKAEAKAAKLEAKREAKEAKEKKSSIMQVKSQESKVGKQKSQEKIKKKKSQTGDATETTESKEKVTESRDKITESKEQIEESKEKIPVAASEEKPKKEKKGKKGKTKEVKSEEIPKTKSKEGKKTRKSKKGKKGTTTVAEKASVTKPSDESVDLPSGKTVSYREGIEISGKESKLQKKKSKSEGEIGDRPSSILKKESKVSTEDQSVESLGKKKKGKRKKTPVTKLRTSQVRIVKSDLQYEKIDETASKEKKEKQPHKKSKKKERSLIDLSEEKELASTSFAKSRSVVATTESLIKKKASRSEASTKKKGKKKKEKKAEEVLPTEPEEVDIMAEIRKMKELAAAEISSEGAEEAVEAEPVKKKKKKGKKGGKKMSKKERAKLAAELAEKQRLEAEAEAARLAAEEQYRLLNEKRLGIEKEKRDTLEQQHRQEQLFKSCRFSKFIEQYNAALAKEEKENDEWNLYIECRKLPDSSKSNAMNTYLHLWEQDIEKTTIQDAAERTQNILKLLDELGYLIDTITEEEMQYLDNWKWVDLLFREHQAQSLDVATYRILRDIEKNMHRIDIPTADFDYHDENFKLSLWLRVQLPVPLFNPRRPPKPRIDITFSNMNLSVMCPQSIEDEAMAIRAMYLSYDHLSDLCSTYGKPAVPQDYNMTLEEYSASTWRSMLKYKYEHRIRKVKKSPEEGQETETTPEQEKEEEEDDEDKVFGPDDEIPTVPWQKLTPTASDYVIYQEELEFQKIRQSLITKVPPGVINLRRFLVLGGIYYVNLLHQPPQPQDFVTMEMTITPLYLPKQLEEVPFCVQYKPPAAPEPGVRRLPEEIEEEMKKQEEEFDKQLLITLTLPEHVIFLELPLVCIWDKGKVCWTQEDVHDVKHNEEKGYLTFRTCRFGIFALATYRYSNFPYQAWDIKPELDDTVTLQITAAILMLEFNVKGGLVALTQLQNSPNNAMQDIVGQYMKLPRLIKIMLSSGVDVFPAFDAFCYIDEADVVCITL